MRVEINGREYLVPACFEKDEDGELCKVPKCRFGRGCIWKMEEVPNVLGRDESGRSKMLNST
jgi:hypothetical protein